MYFLFQALFACCYYLVARKQHVKIWWQQKQVQQTKTVLEEQYSIVHAA